MEIKQSSGVTVIESSKPEIDYMINYKVDDSMSPLHLFFRDHTGTIFTIVTIAVCYFAILFPEPVSRWLSSFFTLHGAIYSSDGVVYEKDIRDICTVVGLTVGLTVLRYFLCHTLFRLIAKWLHIEDTLEKPQLVHKTEEQAWLVLYYTFSFTTGVTIIRKYIGFSLNNVWKDYPQLLYPWGFKLFYLTQCAFYFQCLLLLFTEKHRKDMVNMFIHHVITIALIVISYYTNFSRIGTVVFAIFDAADALLPLSKIMQYGWIVIPGYCIFFLFTAVWVFTRHYLVIKVMVNIYTEPEHILPIIWDPKNGYFVSLVWSKPLFLSLFTLLELLQVLWTINIFRLIYRQLFQGITLGDDRSCKDE
ncbi:hypothetical protein WA577_005146, partial [Blastocystis sp. JDR]